MTTVKKKAQVTVSEVNVNCTQPHVKHAKPAKRAKKSKKSSNAESSACPSISRSPLNTDVPKEKQISEDMARSADESVLSNSEGSRADVIRKWPAFEETLDDLFGPAARTADAKPPRRWELDTQSALFGPEEQMTSENPRHYDVFDMYRDGRRRPPRKRHLDDTQNELFTDHASSTSLRVSHDLESSESESTSRRVKVSRELQINSLKVLSHSIQCVTVRSAAPSGRTASRVSAMQRKK